MKIPQAKQGRKKGGKNRKDCPRSIHKRQRAAKKLNEPKAPLAAPPDFNKSSKRMRNELMRALEAEGELRKESPMVRVARTFYDDPKAMVKVLKHLLPQLKAIELKGLEESPFKLILSLGGEAVKDEDEDKDEEL